jgi:hypothetical protein
MKFARSSNTIRLAVLGALIAAGMFLTNTAFANHNGPHTSGTFSGAKVNAGTVTHTKENGKNILTLSDDFQVPETPDPHWRVVDSKGNTYDLQKLAIKGDKINKSITLPMYVKDVSKVQIWCAFAETVLGEASFAEPVK